MDNFSLFATILWYYLFHSVTMYLLKKNIALYVLLELRTPVIHLSRWWMLCKHELRGQCLNLLLSILPLGGCLVNSLSIENFSLKFCDFICSISDLYICNSVRKNLLINLLLVFLTLNFGVGLPMKIKSKIPFLFVDIYSLAEYISLK